MGHISTYITAYLENRLSPEDREQIDAHMVSCETCRSELKATREVAAELSQLGRSMRLLPVTVERHWASVHRRLDAPIGAGEQGVSRRLTWQMSLSMALAAMALVSGMSLNAVRADGPSIPSIQTPGTQELFSSDTPTLAATHPAAAQTPTLTLTPDK